jgi:hypothetical protein
MPADVPPKLAGAPEASEAVQESPLKCEDPKSTYLKRKREKDFTRRSAIARIIRP